MSSPLSERAETPRRNKKSTFVCHWSPASYGPCGGPGPITASCTPKQRKEYNSQRGHTAYQPSMKGRLCPSLTQNGTCDDIRRCPYSHTVEETRMFNPNFKTKICEFAANGFCEKANLCRYAHSFSELAPMEKGYFESFPSINRNLSSASTVDVSTHNLDCGSNDEMSPIMSSYQDDSPSTRICYQAPIDQRSFIPKRMQRSRKLNTRFIQVPSSYHYVEQLERMRGRSLSYPFLPASFAAPQVIPFGVPGAYYTNQHMMYSMMSPNVVYED
jgi:hypothetical protein